MSSAGASRRLALWAGGAILVCATVGVGVAAMLNGSDALMPAERTVEDKDASPPQRVAGTAGAVIDEQGAPETKRSQHQPTSSEFARRNVGAPSDPDAPWTVAESNTAVSNIGSPADPDNVTFRESDAVRNIGAFADPDVVGTSSTQVTNTQVTNKGNFLDPDVAVQSPPTTPVDTGDSLNPDD